MLKIGEFARLSNITVKALRHYDRLELLEPIEVDDASGYRYYVVEQLARAHRIVALKELGLSLKQIGRLICDGISTEEIRRLLETQRHQLRQQADEVKRQLAMVDFRLRMLDAEEDFPALDVTVKPLPAMWVLSHYNVVHDSAREGLDRMALVVAALERAIADGDIAYCGPAVDLFHGETILPFDTPNLDPQQHEIWLGVEAEQRDVDLERIGHWKVKRVAAVAEAVTLTIVHADRDLLPYERMALLRRWAVAHGYRPADHVRNVSIVGPLQTLDTDAFVAEAQIPIVPDGER